ncbi:transcriptional regulator [Sporosarcina sp. FSL K6-3457]|uniref:transcriptional regulator n=1 Tax=Sporosarcina sp. FSL K6-3457 TaxID=2978204 RepID=UPI0030FBB28E
MRNRLVKSMDRNTVMDMMYLSNSGEVSKRRIDVLRVGEVSFWAYCHLRRSKRTFTIDNVLALVPIIATESRVI